ncbi:MAG: hypothetical protein M0C28_26285 [Candidatus Moduliflexus flocculans]|nr:hypothetical protein [Candidatus Moduliflexus flocculans]
MNTFRATAALALLIAAAPTAWPSAAALNPAASASSVSALPEPYGPDEFPSWLTGARRFEIISLGAFPILLFYTRVAFDLRRWVGNGFDATYAPWPLQERELVRADRRGAGREPPDRGRPVGRLRRDRRRPRGPPRRSLTGSPGRPPRRSLTGRPDGRLGGR